MSATNLSPSEQRSRLARGCSTLARAGQLLSTAGNASQARAALYEVAELMESETDGKVSELTNGLTVARQCRTTADSASEAQILGACRQIATSLARQAGNLANEVKRQAATPSPAAPTPTPAIAVPAQPTLAEPAPIHAPAPDIAPVPALTAAPAPEPARIDHLTIARSAEERAAAKAALMRSQRFAFMSNGTFIDTATNRMWQEALGDVLPHATARRSAAECDTGRFRDWRLPHPAELIELLASGGRESLIAQGVLPAGQAVAQLLLWTAEAQSRWFGLQVKATCCRVGNLDKVVVNARRAMARPLFIRTPAS